jgi:hypothetical protein
VEQKAKDSDDSNAGQKTAKQIEAIIWTEQQQESYDRIKQVFKYTAWDGGKSMFPSMTLLAK